MRPLFILLICGLTALLLHACDDASPVAPSPSDSGSPEDPPTDTPPPASDDGSDLSIRYIQRLPLIDYVWNSSNPAVEGWPTVGQEVIWNAHVFNAATHARDSVTYAWQINGEEVASGVLHFDAEAEAMATLPWTWTFDRHTITFILDHEQTIAEVEERNNTLTVFSDAITVGFYVEQSLYDYFRQHQHKLNVGTITFDDWAQRHINRWNTMLQEALYPTSPDGVLDRVRIDHITIVPDNTLPLVPLDTIPPEDAHASAHPNISDRTVDMQWGFPASHISIYDDHTDKSPSNPFYFNGSLLHELGHARYLTDVYAFRLFHGINSDSVLVYEDSILVAGSRYLPGQTLRHSSRNGTFTGLWLYRPQFDGLMNQPYTFMDQHSAVALNLIAGHRALCGNYNEPCNIGVYLNDLPTENIVHLQDQTGLALAGAAVQVFQAEGVPESNEFYSRRIDGVPDLTLRADEQGHIRLGPNPFGAEGIAQDWEVSNTTALMRVAHHGRVGYAVLDASLFNIQYWSGHTQEATYVQTIELFE